MSLDINSVNRIIKNIIGAIASSRVQILKIVDNIRSEQESLKSQLERVRNDTTQVINEVDELQKQDKMSKRRLVEVSSNFNKYNESDIKSAYEKASEIMVRFSTKKNEEKYLRERRDSLEMALKKSMVNIEDWEKIINQISIAMKYLEGDIASALEGKDNNSEMFIGMKILEAQESERTRIARDIHDGPAQHMAKWIFVQWFLKKILKKALRNLKI